MSKIKTCLISSTGGHYEQLLRLKKLPSKYDTFIVTEKTDYNKNDKGISYFIKQVNRKEILFPLKFLSIVFKSLRIFLREKPDVIISTGTLCSIPMMIIGHLFKKKVIYIESFAKVNSPTITGKFVYKFNLADRFYVQWNSMLEFYPNAVFKGGIY